MIPELAHSLLVFPAETCYYILMMDVFKSRFPETQGQEVLDLWVQNVHPSDFTQESITNHLLAQGIF